MKKKKILMNFKINEEDRNFLKMASNESGLSMTSIVMLGAIKEAKKILKDLKKDDDGIL